MIKDLKKIVGDNLHILRGKRTLFDVAVGTGISDRRIGAIEKGRANVTIGLLEKLCNFYGVSAAELFGYKTKPETKVEYKIHLGKERLIGERVENFFPVPLLRDAGSLGSGYEINEKDIEGTTLIHTSCLKKGGEYQAIKVKGNSMSPLFEEGEIVAVDIKQNNPKNLEGKFVACHRGDYEVMIKRFWEQKEKFYFEALNKDWERENGPILVPKKENLILGKVVWAWKKFE
jgi:SOS-response transcriptional repressor LexA